MDSRNRIASCKRGDRRLLGKVFKSKPIKRERVKSHFDSSKKSLELLKHPYKQMSSQISNNNKYTMAPAFPNPYISRKLNNIDQAQVMKREREDWTRLYHKTLKGIETMIDVQRMVKNMKRMAEEANTTITEIEGSILITSINNGTINATNISQISEDLQYMVQSDMDEQAFQIQRMLANELDHYKEKGNKYVDNNI